MSSQQSGQSTSNSEPNKSLTGMALEGTQVVDISNFLAAPMCSMFLADFGASVIKVERPVIGDEIRRWG